MIWLILGVWLVCVGVLLHLHFEVRRTRYRAPDKWEPATVEGRAMIVAHCPEGREAEAADLVLRADLELSKAGR